MKRNVSTSHFEYVIQYDDIRTEQEIKTLNDMNFSSNEILYSGTFGLMHMIYKLKLC